MKGMRKLSAILLAVMLCVGIINIPVFAAETSQDGLEVTLTTDKDEYSQGEEIAATLTVTNTNDFAVNNVSLESIAPDGYELAKDAEAAKEVETLKAGETLTITVTYVAEENAGSGEEGTTDPSVPGSSDDNKDTNTGKEEGSSDSSSVDTGDGNNIVLWSTLLFIAFAGMVVVLVSKKRGRKLLSILLCITIAGTGVTWPSIEVDAAGTDAKKIEIQEMIQVDGKDVVLKAEVNYQYNVDDDKDEGYLVDTDNDKLPDIDENDYGTDINDPDTDDDGYSDYEEILLGTDPLVANTYTESLDSDNDNLSDLDEVQKYGTDPYSSDTDYDSLTDYDEINVHGTDPTNDDTDGDGLSDYFELAHDLDPTNICTNGSTPDNEVKIKQELDENGISSDLLQDSNLAKPSLKGEVSGDLSEEVYMSVASDSAVEENRSIVGTPIFIDKTEDTEELVLSFDLSSYENELNNLCIVTLNDDGTFEPMDSTLSDMELSCTIEESGTYFVLDLNEFLSSMGIDLSNASESVSTYSMKRSSSDAKGQADIVFAIDTTGSMGDAIDNVIKNVSSFATTLSENYNVQINYALIDFKDLEEDGPGTTKVVKNGSSNWYSNVDSFIDQVENLYATGGGDEPECDIDALETARRLDYRSSANKFIILITDTYYKTANDYGIGSLEEEAELLKKDGINTSVVSVLSCQDDYQAVYESTGGIFADIDSDFGSVLLSLADLIGEETSDGEWVILKHGYKYVKLTEEADQDGDDVSTTDELGNTEVVDLTKLIQFQLAINGVQMSEYSGKTSITVYNAKSDPTKYDTDSDGIDDKKDTAPWQKGLANGIVGAIKICSYGDGAGSSAGIVGHAYVAYTSFIKEDVTFYGIKVNSKDEVAKENDSRADRPKYHTFTMDSNSVISLGGWAGWLPDELKGSWINNELMLFGDSVPSDHVAVMKYITNSQLDKLENSVKSHSKWTYLYNCSAFAADVWNDTLNDNISPYGPWASPKSLAGEIKERDGYELKKPMIAEWPK